MKKVTAQEQYDIVKRRIVKLDRQLSREKQGSPKAVIISINLKYEEAELAHLAQQLG